MTKREYIARHTVIWFARRIPVESPGWATVGMVLPALASIMFVRAGLAAARTNLLIRSIFSHRAITGLEIGVFALAAFVSFSYLCRLLQICCPKYYDAYKVEEQV